MQRSTVATEQNSTFVHYEHSVNLPGLLESLGASLLLSTYQAGRVVSLGVDGQALTVGFSHFDQAMGLCRAPSGLAVGSRQAIWSLPASREIAPSIQPSQTHDIAFLARRCHYSGPLMGHDLVWSDNRLWLVNTLFNGLVTVEGDWSFCPQWKPPFITAWAPGDRCHLNGLALAEGSLTPSYVTVLGRSDAENGWRENKATGGCLLHVPSGDVVLEGLSMPHSPRIYNGQLYVLNSGQGSLIRVDPDSGTYETVAVVPGFTRGLDCYGCYAFIGLSQIRETAIFGGLPIQESERELRSGLAVVNLQSGALESLFWFHSGVQEVFSTLVLPGWRNPAVIGPDNTIDASQTVWMVPQAPS